MEVTQLIQGFINVVQVFYSFSQSINYFLTMSLNVRRILVEVKVGKVGLGLGMGKEQPEKDNYNKNINKGTYSTWLYTVDNSRTVEQ